MCTFVCVCLLVSKKPVCVDELSKPSAAISRTPDKGKKVEIRQNERVEKFLHVSKVNRMKISKETKLKLPLQSYATPKRYSGSLNPCLSRLI